MQGSTDKKYDFSDINTLKDAVNAIYFLFEKISDETKDVFSAMKAIKEQKDLFARQIENLNILSAELSKVNNSTDKNLIVKSVDFVALLDELVPFLRGFSSEYVDLYLSGLKNETNELSKLLKDTKSEFRLLKSEIHSLRGEAEALREEYSDSKKSIQTTREVVEGMYFMFSKFAELTKSRPELLAVMSDINAVKTVSSFGEQRAVGQQGNMEEVLNSIKKELKAVKNEIRSLHGNESSATTRKTDSEFEKKRDVKKVAGASLKDWIREKALSLKRTVWE